MARIIPVAPADRFGAGKRRRVFAGGRRIVVVNDAGTLYAVDDRCPHVGGALSDGSCEAGVITCPWHGARFRLRDGAGIGTPAYRALATFPVSVRDGIVTLTVADDGDGG